MNILHEAAAFFAEAADSAWTEEERENWAAKANVAREAIHEVNHLRDTLVAVAIWGQFGPPVPQVPYPKGMF